MRLAAPTLVGAGLLTLASCVGHLSASPTSPSKGTRSPPQAASASRSAVTWEHGLLRFEVPGPADQPTMTATTAYQDCSCSEYAQYSTPQVWFALFTEYDHGTALSNGHIALSHVRQPVWVIVFTDVPTAASGGGGLPGTAPQQPLVVNQYVLTVVADATSRPLLQVDGEPDSVALAPPPTSGP